MPRHPAPLPEPLRGRIFTTRHARELGVAAHRTYASDLDAPVHGVRAPAGELTFPQLCAATVAGLGADAAISHVSAARFRAFPLPLGLERDDVVHVTVPTGVRAPRGKRIVGHQMDLPDDAVVRLGGVRCTTAVRTLCDLAATLELPQLVAVGDHLVRRQGGLLTIEEVRAEAACWRGRRGRRTLARALELLDPGAESPKESELRVILIEAGFPAPECNRSVYDWTGRFVARVDLAYADLRIAIEYEGDHHRDRRQWRKDHARRRRLEAIGWIYLPVTQQDLENPAALLADLRRALARARARA
jgi:hypothetical protein